MGSASLPSSSRRLRRRLPRLARASPRVLLPLLALFILCLLVASTYPRGRRRRFSSSSSFTEERASASEVAIADAVARVAFTPERGRPMVLVTAVNYPFRDYLTNLNCSLARINDISPQPLQPLVIAMDAAMHSHALRIGFESLHLPMYSSINTLPANRDRHASEPAVQMFGSKGFNRLSKQKLYAVYKVLQAGVDVLFSDADIVWCADAAAEVARIMYATHWDADPFSPRMPHLLMQTAWPRSLLNSGFYYARASPELRDAFRMFLAHDADSENDQVIVNAVMCRRHFNGAMVFNGTNSHPAAPHRPMPVLCMWDGRVDARLLPALRFPTGGEIVDGDKIFHKPRRFITHACGNGDVAVLHNNCILSSKKKARFVAKGIWYVDDKEQSCLKVPAPATVQARKRCGGAKCGPEGDVRRFPDLVV